MNICGLYYLVPDGHYARYSKRVYLQQVDVEAHSTILSTTSRTQLTQTFVNPSSSKGIKQLRYIFPLYEGVSVVGFQCQIGDRVIYGEVKEKEEAKQVFSEAVQRGETAGLLEQLPNASDVFTTTVGNVPPGAKLVVRITYLGELKHDAEVDGIRLTIPNIICPRYGGYPDAMVHTNATEAVGRGISITVDAEMADGSFIQKILSPSHPISVSMGTTSLAANAEPSMSKASATLSLGTAELDKDFVLQIVAKNTGIPKAILETHPSIPNHRALMATLVPKFSLPAEKPEIVFICDRSGSMDGTRIELVKKALQVFLKSLPVGVNFNICSFGSRHRFLWPKSRTYSQATLDEAMAHVKAFQADYGGTEMLAPVKATLENRYKDIPLEAMLLTDGETWDQQALFSYLNKEVIQSEAPIRVFTLGIGNGVSHALIEGVAKAGNGFSQAVGEGEKMDSKVVRMLKGALSPHVTDYTLEVKYHDEDKMQSDDIDEEFEIVEKVTDSLKVKLTMSEKEKAPPKKPISLFDASVDPDKPGPGSQDKTGEAKYAHLPILPPPKIIQAPQQIPPLFAFHRTTVYLLMGPEAPQASPKSVILRGTSNHGPLELEIPIQIVSEPGETIHQLAAKKAIAELEAGRGWLSAAKDVATGKPLKEAMESRFHAMVEREAVRLGVQFQVGGKWCSFVAVEKHIPNHDSDSKEAKTRPEAGEEFEWLDFPNVEQASHAPPPYNQERDRAFSGFGAGQPAPRRSYRGPVGGGSQLFSLSASSTRGEQLDSLQDKSNALAAQSFAFGQSAGRDRSFRSSISGLFGRSSSSSSSKSPSFGSPSPPPPPSIGHGGGGLFGGIMAKPAYGTPSPQPPPPGPAFCSIDTGSSEAFSVKPSNPPAPAAQLFGSTLSGEVNFDSLPTGGSSETFYFEALKSAAPSIGRGSGSLSGVTWHPDSPPPPNPAPSPKVAQTKNRKLRSRAHNNMPLADDDSIDNTYAPTSTPSLPPPSDPLEALIQFQTFEGYWEFSSPLLKALGMDEEKVRQWMQKEGLGTDEKVAMTALCVAYLESKMAGGRDVWELMVDKARGWLGERLGVDGEERVESLVESVKGVL